MAEKKKKKEEGALSAGVVGQVFRFVARKILETRPKDATPGKTAGQGKGKARKDKSEKDGLGGAMQRRGGIRSIEEQLFGDEKKKSKK